MQAGVTTVVLAVSYMSNVLENVMNEHAKRVSLLQCGCSRCFSKISLFQLGISIIFSQEKEPLGTGMLVLAGGYEYNSCTLIYAALRC